MATITEQYQETLLLSEHGPQRIVTLAPHEHVLLQDSKRSNVKQILTLMDHSAILFFTGETFLIQNGSELSEEKWTPVFSGKHIIRIGQQDSLVIGQAIDGNVYTASCSKPPKEQLVMTHPDITGIASARHFHYIITAFQYVHYLPKYNKARQVMLMKDFTTSETVAPNFKIVKMMGGESHMYLLDDLGRVFSRGENAHNANGNNYHSKKKRQFFRITNGGMGDHVFLDVMSGSYHGMFLSSTREVFVLGYNGEQQFGMDASAPLKISFPNLGAVKNIFSGDYSALYTFEKQTLYPGNLIGRGLKSKCMIGDTPIPEVLVNAQNSDRKMQNFYESKGLQKHLDGGFCIKYLRCKQTNGWVVLELPKSKIAFTMEKLKKLQAYSDVLVCFK